MGEVHIHIGKDVLANTSVHVHLGEKTTSTYGGSGVHARSGAVRAGSSVTKTGALKPRQRIRPKFYVLQAVPPCETSQSPEPATRTQALQSPAVNSRHEDLQRDAIKLELSSGNQMDPVTWESFKPTKARGLWQFSVRRDFGRMIGVLTLARDPDAVWIVSEWTPKGSLVLSPVSPDANPKMMLTPVAS